METRFRLSVQNALRNLLRSRRRRQTMTRAIGIGPAVGEFPAHAIPDRRLDGVSLRHLVGAPAFSQLSAWALRRPMANLRDAALRFARRNGDDDFLVAIERLTDG